MCQVQMKIMILDYLQHRFVCPNHPDKFIEFLNISLSDTLQERTLCSYCLTPNLSGIINLQNALKLYEDRIQIDKKEETKRRFMNQFDDSIIDMNNILKQMQTMIQLICQLREEVKNKEEYYEGLSLHKIVFSSLQHLNYFAYKLSQLNQFPEFDTNQQYVQKLQQMVSKELNHIILLANLVTNKISELLGKWNQMIFQQEGQVQNQYYWHQQNLEAQLSLRDQHEKMSQDLSFKLVNYKKGCFDCLAFDQTGTVIIGAQKEQINIFSINNNQIISRQVIENQIGGVKLISFSNYSDQFISVSQRKITIFKIVNREYIGSVIKETQYDINCITFVESDNQIIYCDNGKQLVSLKLQEKQWTIKQIFSLEGNPLKLCLNWEQTLLFIGCTSSQIIIYYKEKQQWIFKQVINNVHESSVYSMLLTKQNLLFTGSKQLKVWLYSDSGNNLQFSQDLSIADNLRNITAISFDDSQQLLFTERCRSYFTYSKLTKDFNCEQVYKFNGNFRGLIYSNISKNLIIQRLDENNVQLELWKMQ